MRVFLARPAIVQHVCSRMIHLIDILNHRDHSRPSPMPAFYHLREGVNGEDPLEIVRTVSDNMKALGIKNNRNTETNATQPMKHDISSPMMLATKVG